MANVTLLADLNIPGNLLIEDGSFYLNSFDLTVVSLDIQDTLKLQGNETITIGGVPVNKNLETLATVGPTWSVEFAETSIIAIVNDLAIVFFNLIMGGGKTHKFNIGIAEQITINGSWSSTGSKQAPATLRSVTEDSWWYVNLIGNSDLEDKVDSKDSNASAGALVWARESIDSGNLVNWNLQPAFNQSNSPLGNSTWGEILFKIRSRINEPNPAFFTDEEIMCFFNQTQLYFSRETKFRKVEQAFDIIETESEPTYQYALMPQDFLGVLSCGLQSKTNALDLTWLRYSGLVSRSHQGYQDQAFYLVNRGEMRLVQPVDSTTHNLLVTFYGAAIPFADPEDLDAFTYVYDEYLEDVILGTVADCYLKRRDYEDYRFVKDEFDKRVKEAIRAEGRRTGHKQFQISR